MEKLFSMESIPGAKNEEDWRSILNLLSEHLISLYWNNYNKNKESNIYE